MSIADVDQGSRVRQLRVHEELFYRFRIVDRAVSAYSLDLRWLRSYDIVAFPRAVGATLPRPRRVDGVLDTVAKPPHEKSSLSRHREDAIAVTA